MAIIIGLYPQTTRDLISILDNDNTYLLDEVDTDDLKDGRAVLFELLNYFFLCWVGF